MKEIKCPICHDVLMSFPSEDVFTYTRISGYKVKCKCEGTIYKLTKPSESILLDIEILRDEGCK